jgi:hypothetical protein
VAGPEGCFVSVCSMIFHRTIAAWLDGSKRLAVRKGLVNRRLAALPDEPYAPDRGTCAVGRAAAGVQPLTGLRH